MSDIKLPIMDEFSGVATVTQVGMMQSNGAARVVDHIVDAKVPLKRHGS